MEHPIRAHDPDANALTCVDGNIPKHRLNANISRLSCPYLRAIFGRHHLLTKSFGKNAARNRATKGGNEFVAICRFNLSLFAASCR
jgi:hypothetical protein